MNGLKAGYNKDHNNNQPRSGELLNSIPMTILKISYDLPFSNTLVNFCKTKNYLL